MIGGGPRQARRRRALLVGLVAAGIATAAASSGTGPPTATAPGPLGGTPRAVTAGGAGTAALLRDRLAGDADTGRASPRDTGVFGEIASAAAVAQRDAVARTAFSQQLLGGTWSRYGTPPVLNNTHDYKPVDAIPTFTGRVTDFAVDAAGGRLYVAVGLSGIFVSADVGRHWRNLTDALPNTTAGTVAFSPAHGGTLFDGTGDFDGGYLGLGLFRSLDGGASWQKAAGLPDRLMTTRISVDPTNPEVIYVATSRGLYRSADDGVSFTNVALPVGTTEAGGPDCAGDLSHPQCALANVVTDVVVRSGDAHDAGGEVLAAVGWERGVHLTSKGWSNANGNGIYASPHGLPGTFANLHASAHGFTSPQSHIGRVSLGNAVGSGQNHDVVWAMVQDAQEENGQLPFVDPAPSAVPAPCALAPCYTTNLDNIYLSTDFGKTWKAKLPPAQTLGVSCPVSATDQCFLLAAPVVGNYSPGVQARYNNYIRPDPTSTDSGGNPTRIVFGLEELWEINLNDAANRNPTGLVVPRTIGRYFGNGFCPVAQAPAVTVPNPPVCPFSSDAPTTTHPDQHRAVWLPDGGGGVTLVSGDDGGVYIQRVAAGADFANNGWGDGANLDMPTTLNYDLAVSSDGVVYTGLQDNGEVRVEPGGRQVEVYGGDAFYSATDPHNSKVIYEEYTFGNMNVSTDGGHTWQGINPSLTAAQFSTPFVMDATDAHHLVTGGRDIEETVSGPNTTVNPVAKVDTGLDADTLGAPSPTAATDWKVVYDLGTGNAISAVDTRGSASYAGFCGPCYVASTVHDFAGGLATNVGGSAPGAPLSKAGWHKAKAIGLPQRYITSVRIDPQDSRTVYATLANYDPTVEYRAPGVLGDSHPALGHGHVFKSTDAGDHFTDITGNLPDAVADWVIVRGGQLIVSTNVGVFMSQDRNGRTWGVLGALPVLHMTTLELQPGNENRLYAATYGHGVLVYDFPQSLRTPTPSALPPVVSGGGGEPNTAAARPDALGLSLLALALGTGTVLLRRRRRSAGRHRR